MKKSIVIVGPAGCGKSRNAKALAEAYGLSAWIDADEVRGAFPPLGHLILANAMPKWQRGKLEVVPFEVAMQRIRH